LAEVGKMITGMKFNIFWTPAMALKKMPVLASIIQWWDNPIPCLAPQADKLFTCNHLLNFGN